MEAINNRSTIRLTDSFEGFSYHIGKYQLDKKSTVSKSKHPITEVEAFKAKLLDKKLLIDVGKNYVLRKPIHTSLLMARNLHEGSLINTRSLNWNRGGYYSLPLGDLLEDVKLGNLTTFDSPIGKAHFLDSQRIVKIQEIEIDFSCLSGHDGDIFNPIEQLFFDALKERGLISRSSRHGLTEKQECDIVDDLKETQIEVVAAFKNRISTDKKSKYDYNSIGLECVDNVLICPSEPLLNKYYKKNYTPKFQKKLAIYCLGNRLSVTRLAQRIRDAIVANGAVKNSFESVYIIWNDFINDNKTYFSYFDKDKLKIEEIETSLCLLKTGKEVTFDSLDTLNTKTHYFLQTESIFKDNSLRAMAFFTAKEIIELVEILHIYV